MNSITRDDVLTALALVILLFSAMVTWIYSFGVLLGIVVIALAWYFRK